MILLHGIGASAERWLSIAPTLSKYFRVIVPDIVGFGYSDKPTVEYTIGFFMDFLRGFLENLRIHTPILVGSSLGGYLATEFAIRFNTRVKKLVLADSAGIMRSSTNVLDQYIMAHFTRPMKTHLERLWIWLLIQVSLLKKLSETL